MCTYAHSLVGSSVLQYRKYAKEMVDWICDYYASVEKMPVRSEVEPGYLRPLLPSQAPQAPEGFAAIMRDVQDKIMPGDGRLGFIACVHTVIVQGVWVCACSNPTIGLRQCFRAVLDHAWPSTLVAALSVVLMYSLMHHMMTKLCGGCLLLACRHDALAEPQLLRLFWRKL